MSTRSQWFLLLLLTAALPAVGQAPYQGDNSAHFGNLPPLADKPDDGNLFIYYSTGKLPFDLVNHRIYAMSLEHSFK